MGASSVIHPSADALRAFALGKLDDSTASVLMSHLDGCPACCKEVAALTGDDFLGRLRQAHGRSVTPTPAGSLADAAPKPPANPSNLLNVPPELANNPQYEIRSELGRGGMGVVYLARNKLMDRLEVLKVVNKALLDRPGSVERFLREIRSAAKLSHPNVVAAYSAVQSGDLLAFAMEYVEGDDLARLVKSQGPLPVAHACYYAQQAALGLQHAYESGMVHRDIKPQNLILTRKGKKHLVKVLDFGLAKATREKAEQTELTGEGAMLGTPDFVAPEQTLDAAHADIRADIYSLGCTLYYLLTGAPPFKGRSLYEVLQAHHSMEARPLNLIRPEVPEELAAVVRKMMAKEPAKRYQTPAEVVKALSVFGKSGAKGTLPNPSPELSMGVAEAERGSVRAVKPEQPTAPAAGAAKPKAPVTETAHPVAWDTLTEDSITSVQPRKSGARRHRRSPVMPSSKKQWLIGAGLGVGVLLLVLLGMWASGVFKVKTNDGTIVLENLPPDAEVLVDGAKVTVTWGKDSRKAEVTVKPGSHKVEVKKDGFGVDGKELTLKEGDREIFTVRLLPEKRVAKANPPPENVSPKPESPKPAYVNSLGMKFRLIPAGKFIMGSEAPEIERFINLKLGWPPAEQFESEGPAHEVEITQPFYIGIHEVTVGQFRQFVKAMDYKTQAEKEGAYRNFPDGEFKLDGDTNWRNPGFEQTDDHPVVCVSWNDAVAFCAWLSGKEGRKYRLPSEAEWEYCCRARTTTRFCCGDDETRLKEFANLADESFKQKFPQDQYPCVSWDDGYPFTAPVGQFQANAFGLHDMHGNAWELCADWYDKDYYKNSPKQDPPGPSAGGAAGLRVTRGGTWKLPSAFCRSTFRGISSPVTQALGFRVVLAVAAAPADGGFVPLFNGKDLKGWVVDSGDSNAWQVKDGELVVRGTEKDAFWTQGYLLTEKEYSDYILRFQFLQVGRKDATGGVALRAVPGETSRDSFPGYKDIFPFHLTVMLGEFSIPGAEMITGSLWWSPNSAVQPLLQPDQMAEMRRVGEWNSMEIEMRGQSLRIAVNGRDVQNVLLNKTRPQRNPAPGLSRFSGRIGFLKRTGEVRYRNIEIKELPPAAASAPSQSVEVLTPAQAARKVGQKVKVEFRVQLTGWNPARFIELYSEEYSCRCAAP